MLFSYGPFGRVGCVDSLLCSLNNFALQNYNKKMTYARVGQKKETSEEISLAMPYGAYAPASAAS